MYTLCRIVSMPEYRWGHGCINPDNGPEHCHGYIRRLYQRQGKKFVPIGMLCDECNYFYLDKNRESVVYKHLRKYF